MTGSVPRRSAHAIVASGAGLAVMFAAVPAAPAAQSRPACSKIRQNQMLDVPVAWRYREQLSRVDNGQLRTRVLKDQTRVFGRLKIAAATCKGPGGKWIVINPAGVGYDSVGMDAVGNVRNSGLMRGWGLGIRGGAGGSSPRMALQLMHCGQDNFFKTLKAITGVPIPRVPFSVTTGLWAAGKFLPKDKVRCGNVGVKRLIVYATSTGALRMRDLTATDCCTEQAHFPSPNGGWNFTRSYVVGPITARAS